MRISDRALAQLRAKGANHLVTTEEARSIAGLSVQQWQRLVRQKDFPLRVHVGRAWCVSAHLLADFLEKLNAIDAGMTFTQAAAYARTTTYTLRDLADAGRFIDPLGLVHGHPRYSREGVEAWYRKRLGGLQPPEIVKKKAKDRKR